MSFKVRTWALGKTVSSLALIVSTCFLTAPVLIPVTLADNSANSNAGGNPYSNITILDLYPELKEYLFQKALSQLETSTEKYNLNNLPAQKEVVQNVPNAWDYGPSVANINANTNPNPNIFGNIGNVNPAYYGSAAGSGVFSREDSADSDPMDTFNQYSEILKYYHPFGSPEIYSSWKYKPPGGPHDAYSGWKSKPAAPSYSTSHSYPIWDAEEPEISHHVGYELTKDFSCVAGLLGLKTLKTLKVATIFKKLKLFTVFFIAFKLGLFLSPIAIPLLFPIILIATIAKILPLVLIIVLLLKLLKKQVKIKKPLGKLLDRTGSLFFDDVDVVTERVMKSQECVDKISCDLSRKSTERVRRVNNKRLEDLDDSKSAGDN